MQDILIKSAKTVLTMDDAGRELAQTDILLRQGVIAKIGPNLSTTGQIIHGGD